jgi:hypothetical protein
MIHASEATASTHLTLMVTNPWVNRITALVVLAAIYAAGYAGGKDAAIQAHQSHPACHSNLKP